MLYMFVVQIVVLVCCSVCCSCLLFSLLFLFVVLTLEVVVLDSLQANESLPTTAAVGGVEQVSEEGAQSRRGADKMFVIIVKSSVADDALSSPVAD